MNTVLISVNDLADQDIRQILSRADELRSGSTRRIHSSNKLVGLLFFEPSLRTRVGFAAAAARLGWQSVEVMERRRSKTSSEESFEDTLRTVSGLVDVVVARPARSLDRAPFREDLVSAFVNGGDAGPTAEHPTQALIDLFAIEKGVGSIAGVRIGICGDPRMRAVRSLLLLLSRRRPARISIFADPSHEADAIIPASLGGIVDFRLLPEVDDIDVLYVAGIPHESLPIANRDRLLVTPTVMSRLPITSIVLSPMPVIDEIADGARRDRRIRMHWQSDQGLFIRMAVLEYALGHRDVSS